MVVYSSFIIHLHNKMRNKGFAEVVEVYVQCMNEESVMCGGVIPAMFVCKVGLSDGTH